MATNNNTALDILKSKIRKRKELQSIPLDTDTINEAEELHEQCPHFTKTEIMRLGIQYAFADEKFRRALKELSNTEE